MSSYSPLSDPVFLLQWQVHVAVVSLFAILAVWWGTTRLPWYVPPTVVLAALWLFVPLEAPDPALVLLIATPLLAGGCFVARRLLRPLPRSAAALEEAPPGESPWRFRLSDTLWLTFVVGLACALVAQLWKLPWPTYRTNLGSWGVYWADVVTSGVCLIVLAVAVFCASLQNALWRRLLGGVVVVLLAVASAGVHLAVVRHEFLLLTDWEITIGSISPAWMNLSNPDGQEIFGIYLDAFLAFVLIVGVGVIVVVTPPEMKYRRLWLAVRVFGGGVLAMLILRLGIVYAEIRDRPDWPAETFPARNRREELKSIVVRHAELNPQEVSIAALRAGGKASSAADAQKVGELFAELDELLQGDEITLFDSRVDQADFSNFTSLADIQSVRGLARALNYQAKDDWAAGRRADGLKHDRLNLRLASVLQRRSTSIETLVGIAVEGIATHHLDEIRKDLTPEEIAVVQAMLHEAASSREPPGLLFARDGVYSEEGGGWRERLAAAARRLLGRAGNLKEVGPDAFMRRDAMVALLQTELALRSYHARQGRWPADLSSLVPADLPELPIDPYSHQPLRYKTAQEGDEETFVLYSVGRDGDDDGGKFGNFSDAMIGRSEEHDLDLETWLRP